MESNLGKKDTMEGNILERTSKYVASNESSSRDKLLFCKYCDAKFSCSHALRGHENGHKDETEAERKIHRMALPTPYFRNQANGVGGTTIGLGGASLSPLSMPPRYYCWTRMGLVLVPWPGYQILSPPQPTNMHQFQTLRAQGSASHQHRGSYQPLLSSSVRQGASSSRSHPINQAYGVGGTTIGIGGASPLSMTQNNMHMPRCSWPRLEPGLYIKNPLQPIRPYQFHSSMAQGSASHQHHGSYRTLVSSSILRSGSEPHSSHPSSCYTGNFGQENGNSSRRPQNESIERPHFNVSKRKFDQESSNISSRTPQYAIRERSPDLNDKRLEPSCDDDQASVSVTPQNAITEGLDLNVKPSCDDENSGQQISSSSMLVNGAEEKFDLTLKL